MFLPLLKVGLSNIYQSLVDGGHFVAAAWASQDKVPFMSLIFDVAAKIINKPINHSNTPGPFSLSDQNKLKNVLMESKFKGVSIERMNLIFDFDSQEEYIRFIQEISPINAMLSNEPNEKKQQIWNTFANEIKKYMEKSTGHLKIDNEVIIVTGTK